MNEIPPSRQKTPVHVTALREIVRAVEGKLLAIEPFRRIDTGEWVWCLVTFEVTEDRSAPATERLRIKPLAQLFDCPAFELLERP